MPNRMPKANAERGRARARSRCECELAAIDFAGRGWSVIPIEARGKRPIVAWQEFQRRAATPDEIRASDKAYVHQFVWGEMDGPVPFQYPSAPYREQIYGATHA